MALDRIPGEEKGLEVWLCSEDDAHRAVYSRTLLQKQAEATQCTKIVFMIPKSLTREINNILAGKFRFKVSYIFFDTPPKRTFFALPRELPPTLAKQMCPPGYMVLKRPDHSKASRILPLEAPAMVSEESPIALAPEGEDMDSPSRESEVHVADPETVPLDKIPSTPVPPPPTSAKKVAPAKVLTPKEKEALEQYKATMADINARAKANALKSAPQAPAPIPGA